MAIVRLRVGRRWVSALANEGSRRAFPRSCRSKTWSNLLRNVWKLVRRCFLLLPELIAGNIKNDLATIFLHLRYQFDLVDVNATLVWLWGFLDSHILQHCPDTQPHAIII